ncbi:hypothetical protein [Streptomyces sp. Ncost-T10-10d]|uniref:hypothetical protein n=1 Tax=Streptomyces sp. Ncost-T10-10d TaxID=1839774 RepID=UPI000B84CC96|nr:hypothetical protein [Streptomyces sp. Ncost-T10-10d]
MAGRSHRTAPPRNSARCGADALGDQSAGRACIRRKNPLTTGAVGVGIIRDRLGAHNLDTEVRAGPCCQGEQP